METTAEWQRRRSLFCSVVLLAAITKYCSAKIVRIGPEIQPILATIESSAGSTFLVNDVVLDHGILFAFSAFFVNTSRVRFQVWRPYKNDGTSSGAMFQLVFEAAMTPSVSLSREDLYIASTLTRRCPVVQSGDKVGVFFESSPTAISRYFDPEGANTYRYQLQNLSVPAEVKDVVVFDTLRFPYKLNFQAWIDTINDTVPLGDGSSPENDEADCPMSLIPSHEIETITISPGMTGATGPSGPPGDTGPIGPTGPIGLIGATGPPGLLGPFGAQGNEGMTGDTGPFGASGITGPEGQVGATGLVGSTGANGQIGPVGPPGPPGSAVPVENQASSSSDGCTGFLMSENFMVGMVIWLCILSLLLLTILVMLIVLCFELRIRRKEDKKVTTAQQPWVTTGPVQAYPRPTPQNDYDRSTLARNPLQSQLREESSSNYSMDIIETPFNEADMKGRKRDEPPYAVLGDPSTTSMSDDGGIYNPVYTETDSAPAAEDDQLNNDSPTPTPAS